MSYIGYEVKDHIVTLTVSREEALNALNTEVLVDLDNALDRVEADADVYCAIITGAGEKAFVAGADIMEMKDLTYEQAYEFGRVGNKIFRKIEGLRVPVIAMINGYALGGGSELALASDIRIAADNSVFGFPEVTLGVIPGYGGTQLLPRIVGIAAAKKLLYTAIRIDAHEAYRIGLVNEVVPRAQLKDFTLKLAETIAKQAPVAVTNLKKAISQGMKASLDTAINIEMELFAQCFETMDQKNAMEAFVNKVKLERFENK